MAARACSWLQVSYGGGFCVGTVQKWVIKREEEVQGGGRSAGVFGIASSYLWTRVQAGGPLMSLMYLEILWYGWRAKRGVKAEPDCLTM